MKKPWIEITRDRLNFLLDSPPKFEVKSAKIPSEIFAIFYVYAKGLSVQAT